MFSRSGKVRLDPYFLAGVIAAAGIAAVVIAQRVQARRVEFAEVPGSLARTFDSLGLTHAIGRGAVVVQEITDFQCPGCAESHMKLSPALEAKALSDGIRYVVLEVPPKRYSAAASIAAHCVAAADSTKYWRYRSILFQQQARWSTAYPVEPHLKSLARGLVGDSLMDRCIRERGAVLLQRIDAAGTAAFRAGVRFTPVWSINGRVVTPDSVLAFINR